MELIRALVLFFLLIADSQVISRPETNKPFPAEKDCKVLTEFSGEGVNFSDPCLPWKEPVSEIIIPEKNRNETCRNISEGRSDLIYIKISLLIIPGLNLAKLIFPFHFFL